MNKIALLAGLFLAGLPFQAIAFPREGIAEIENGKAAPFVGQWEMGLPDDEQGAVTIRFVTCDLPVDIEAADDTHIRYLGPRNEEADAAIALQAEAGHTAWLPLAGGPRYVVVWVSPDSFYLYDIGETGEAEWSWPYLFRRCP